MKLVQKIFVASVLSLAVAGAYADCDNLDDVNSMSYWASPDLLVGCLLSQDPPAAGPENGEGPEFRGQIGRTDSDDFDPLFAAEDESADDEFTPPTEEPQVPVTPHFVMPEAETEGELIGYFAQMGVDNPESYFNGDDAFYSPGMIGPAKFQTVDGGAEWGDDETFKDWYTRKIGRLSLPTYGNAGVKNEQFLVDDKLALTLFDALGDVLEGGEHEYTGDNANVGSRVVEWYKHYYENTASALYPDDKTGTVEIPAPVLLELLSALDLIEYNEETWGADWETTRQGIFKALEKASLLTGEEKQLTKDALTAFWSGQLDQINGGKFFLGFYLPEGSSAQQTHIRTGTITPTTDGELPLLAISERLGGTLEASYNGSTNWGQTVNVDVSFDSKTFNASVGNVNDAAYRNALKLGGHDMSFAASGVINGATLVSTGFSEGASGVMQGSFIGPKAEGIIGAYDVTKNFGADDVRVTGVFDAANTPVPAVPQ